MFLTIAFKKLTNTSISPPLWLLETIDLWDHMKMTQLSLFRAELVVIESPHAGVASQAAWDVY